MNQQSVRYLVLWLTTACNLSCRYCYRKESAPATMSREVAREALALAAASGRPFHVQLAGGEPTLEPGLIEFVGRTVREAGWKATLAIQTNGTLVDHRLVDLCRRFAIAMGISLDGPPAVQESLRGRSGATFRGLYLLEAEGIPVRITTVLSAANVCRLADLALSLSLFPNILGMGFDPLVMTGRAQTSEDLLPSPEQVRTGVQKLMKALEQMKRHCKSSLEWRELQKVRHALAKVAEAGPYCHACLGESLAVHPDGRVYPCGQTVGDPEMNAGMIDSVDWASLRTCYQGLRLRGACSSCSLEGRCPGDCPSRLRYNQGGAAHTMCSLYQAIAEELIGNPTERSVS